MVGGGNGKKPSGIKKTVWGGVNPALYKWEKSRMVGRQRITVKSRLGALTHVVNLMPHLVSVVLRHGVFLSAPRAGGIVPRARML